MIPPLCLTGCAFMAFLEVTASCFFPEYLQTNGTVPPRDWRTRIRDRYTRFQARVVVDGDQLRHLSNETSTFSRTCLEAVGSDRFLVSHKEKGQRRISYTCFQVVRRSDSVWQMRTGAAADRPEQLGLCANVTWVLDGWIVVDRSRVLQAENTGHHPRCALTGGFSIRFSPPSGSTQSILDAPADCEVSNGNVNEVRVESRCLEGADDLYVYFKSRDCTPSAGGAGHGNGSTVAAPQRLVCLADWHEGQYSFVMLRHDRLPYAWLLRLPTQFISSDDSFNAHTFTDLFAPTTNKVADLALGHRHLGVVRDPPRPVTSLCVDEHESCDSMRRGACAAARTGSESVFNCARTCGVCNATRPFVCTFPADWIGVWVDAGDARTVTFNQTVLTVGEGGDSFHCVEWRFASDSPAAGAGSGGGTHIKPSSDVMLVAAYRNGCRLRYLCARVLKKSPSVLFVKYSRAILWPFNVTSVDMIDCRLFAFLPEAAGGASGVLPSKHFRLLYSHQPRQAVQCNLPNALTNLTVEYGDGLRCPRAASVLESASGTLIFLKITGCHSSNYIPTAYECVLSFRATLSNDLTIFVRSSAPLSSSPSSASTRQRYHHPSAGAAAAGAALGAGALHCWIFPDDRPDQFYLYEGSKCNDSVRRDDLDRRPLALIAFSKAGSVAADSKTTPSSSRAVLRRYQPSSSSSSLSSSSSSSSSGNLTNDTRWTHLENTDFPSASSNPVVLFLAMLIFAIVYIPCLCTSAS